ncbi:MAG: glcE [Panacagrimonas sp.]|jgi:glycolate oxidase FAD binding subunit|nr:glycolate oxidase subunit GlcE [Panacagrimonas sp.]MCC2656931.1 glcE [Panacagrimonas sp.]
MTSSAALRPVNVQEAADAVREAAAAKSMLRIVGGGTRRPLMCASDGNTRELHSSALTGVTRYEPEELVLSVRAGTPLDFVEDLLAERGQMLAFDPPRHVHLHGTLPARTTIGGVLGSGWAGPRRLSAGNVRDHLLGFEAVSGRGEVFRAGGRVIKNVTGYDLSKLMVGSWGTLALLTEVTLRVLPRPQHEATLLVDPLEVDAALALLRRAMALPLEVSCAACLPDGRAALRLEGFRASVDERLRQLAPALGVPRAARAILADESAALWNAVRDVQPFAADAPLLWRLSLPSTAAARTVASVVGTQVGAALFDWAGALVWLAMSAEADAERVRAKVDEAGGHAWRVRAPEALRARLPVAPPQPAPIAALSRRVKQGFDPFDVLGDGPFTSMNAPGIG